MEILLVDDNTDYLMPMKDALYEHGYTVYAADDGKQASRIMATVTVDLIISDIRMPDLDGLQLHKLARQMKQYVNTKFVFISGYKDMYSGQLQLAPERDYFIDKTMGAHDILRFIDRLMFGKYAELWV